jgi:hypothetical protein
MGSILEGSHLLFSQIVSFEKNDACGGFSTLFGSFNARGRHHKRSRMPGKLHREGAKLVYGMGLIYEEIPHAWLDIYLFCCLTNFELMSAHSCEENEVLVISQVAHREAIKLNWVTGQTEHRLSCHYV